MERIAKFEKVSEEEQFLKDLKDKTQYSEKRKYRKFMRIFHCRNELQSILQDMISFFLMTFV